MNEKQKMLSPELQVACEIYKAELNKESIWQQKLISNFEGQIDEDKVKEAINTLFDWGILSAEYGETINGKAGRLYLISNSLKPTIKSLYESYCGCEKMESELEIKITLNKEQIDYLLNHCKGTIGLLTEGMITNYFIEWQHDGVAKEIRINQELINKINESYEF